MSPVEGSFGTEYVNATRWRQCHRPIDRIAALYAVEAHIAGQPPGERARVRRDRSGPIVEDLRWAIDCALAQLSPKASMAVALRYGRKPWPLLTRLLHHGEVEIDNGVAERALRS
ncbi:MAG: transposase, partial [Sphingomonas sp.]|nr:transposase [Sphingomonas sp.]